MDRRVALAAVAGLMILFLIVVTRTGDSSPDTTVSLPSVTADAVEAARSEAVGAVLQYWKAISDGDAGATGELFDLSPSDRIREVGLAEYSVAFGGTYLAECGGGVIVGDEVIVDCIVEVVDEALATAYDIGANPTQFRVRNGKISRVGYLKPYSTVDLAISQYAKSVDAAAFEAACSNPDETFQADAGVTYNGLCGEHLAGLVADLVATLATNEACGENCDATLLRAIRPSRV